MKFISSSFFIALMLAAFVSSILYCLDYFFLNAIVADKLLGFILISSGVMFFSSWVLLETLVFKKIVNVALRINSQLKSNKNNIQSSVNAIANLEMQVKKWTEERQEEIDQLEKLENYRKEYLGNVSHELKTPIFNIQGYVFTLLDGGLEDKTINHKYLLRASKSVDRMIAILEDLQTITQLEKGELEIDEERFDIVALAKDAMDTEELKAKQKKISFEFSNAVSQPFFVLADRFRIRQVIVNLIINSIRYGREDGKTSIKIYEQGEKIIVDVSDSGIGIPKEHLQRVFERFYRVDKSRSREQGGTGLGLSIVKHILEAHGQSISVTSTEGIGSIFTFTLKRG